MKRNLYLDQLGKKSLEASKSIFNLDEKIKNKVLYDYIKIINSNMLLEIDDTTSGKPAQ